MARNKTTRRISGALAVQIAAVNAAAAPTGTGTAVLETPAATTQVLVVVPPSQEVLAQAAQEVAASKVQADAAGVDPATVQALKAFEAGGKHIKDSSISKPERQLVKQSAMEVLIGVGLGDKSQGYGPVVRQVMILGLKDMLKLTSIKKDLITADNLLKLIKLDTFAADAPKHLAKYQEGLKADVAEATLGIRKANAGRAKKWIDAGMFSNYATALETVIQLGRQAEFRTDMGTITMPLDRALGVAFGRNITASELMKANEKQVVKAPEKAAATA